MITSMCTDHGERTYEDAYEFINQVSEWTDETVDNCQFDVYVGEEYIRLEHIHYEYGTMTEVIHKSQLSDEDMELFVKNCYET